MRRRSVGYLVAAVAVIAALGVLIGWGYYGQESRPSGDPDPSGLRMAAIAPVLSVAPADATGLWRQKNKPVWDSCDGMAGTYGWDDVTVDMEWAYRGHDEQVFAHVDAAMRAHGWRLVTSSEPGDWAWSKKLPKGVVATANLSGGAGSAPTNWGIEASAPPAVHPASGC